MGPSLSFGRWQEALHPPSSACPSAPHVPKKQGVCGLHSLCHLPSSLQPSLCLPAAAVSSPVSVRGLAQERSPTWGQAGSRVGSTRAYKMCPAGRRHPSHLSLFVFSKEGDPERGKATAPCLAQSQMISAWFGH